MFYLFHFHPPIIHGDTPPPHPTEGCFSLFLRLGENFPVQTPANRYNRVTILLSTLSNCAGTEDTILYAACFDANGGVFEPLFGQEDAIISDELNHASIIDGVRLCKAVRYRYKHANMADLEEQLKISQAQRYRIIVTFSGTMFTIFKRSSLSASGNPKIL